MAVWCLEKMSLFTQHNVIPYLYDLLCSLEHKRYLEKKSVFVHAMKVNEVQCCFRPHSISLNECEKCSMYNILQHNTLNRGYLALLITCFHGMWKYAIISYSLLYYHCICIHLVHRHLSVNSIYETIHHADAPQRTSSILSSSELVNMILVF